MQYCTTTDGAAVVIDPVEHVADPQSLDDVVERVVSRLRQQEFATGEEVLASVVAALGDELTTLSIEDQLELRRVVTYPGDPDALPEQPAIEATVGAVLSTFGEWQQGRQTSESIQA